MNQFAIIACIGSLILTLTRPVASYNQWAFDVGQPLSSCSNSDVNFLKPKMWRVVTIANVTGNWVSQNQGSSLLSNKPAIARKLLGSSDAKYAQMPFLGGWIMGAGEQANAWGIANLVGPTDILSANPLTASHNVLIYCNCGNLGDPSWQFYTAGDLLLNRVTNTYFTLDLPQNMDSLVPGSPIIIVHNDDSDWFGDTGRKNTFLFLNRGWLDAVKTEAAADPFQPWDTRLSIYNMRLEIFKKRWTIAKWRPWRNAQVPIPPGPQGSSDIAMTWSSVDSQLLNALIQSFWGGTRSSRSIDRKNRLGGQTFQNGSSWPSVVQMGKAGTAVKSSITFTYMALAVYSYLTGFKIDVNSGNYTGLLEFNHELDYGSPDGLYHRDPPIDGSAPPPYTPGPGQPAGPQGEVPPYQPLEPGQDPHGVIKS